MSNPGFDVKIDTKNLELIYGENTFGPVIEKRRLDDIRESLLDYNAKGPDVLYGIAMHVGDKKDKQIIEERNAVYAIVVYNKGQIGNEPIRSQGHIHAISKFSNKSTCEVYEILLGKAIIYMQESGSDDAGRCYAVYAEENDVVIVPPNWVHATINADINNNMAFGSWSVSDYKFEYKEVREHKGIAFYPIVKDGDIEWIKNDNYSDGSLIKVKAKEYPEFNITNKERIYTQFINNPDNFDFVANPDVADHLWREF